MATAIDEAIRTILGEISAPAPYGSLTDAARIAGLSAADGRVTVALEVDSADTAKALEPARAEAQARIEALDGVDKALVMLTADAGGAGSPCRPQDPVPRPRAQPRPTGGTPMQPSRPASGPAGASGRPALAPSVKYMVAVASGKGGVGKSTTAANLALALSQLGRSVGLLDADIYGPSMPRMMGVEGKPETKDGKTLEPMAAHGIAMMSIGLLVEEDRAMIWRGPMVQSALTQMLRDVNWGALDVLVIDMPPGTGDAQLTLAQQVPLAGAVIVSTPQDIALIDARKGIGMFKETHVPILGIVENMSYHVCRACGHREEVFGHGGARADAEKAGVPFLGELPLDLAIRVTSDGGTPIAVADPESPNAAAYRAIAEQVWAALEGNPAKPAPRIRMV